MTNAIELERPFASISEATRQVGFWSAVAAPVFSIVYDVAQIAERLGWLGSNGNSRSSLCRQGRAVELE